MKLLRNLYDKTTVQKCLHRLQMEQSSKLRWQGTFKTKILQIPANSITSIRNYNFPNQQVTRILDHNRIHFNFKYHKQKKGEKRRDTHKATTFPSQHSTPNHEQWLVSPSSSSSVQLAKAQNGSFTTLSLNLNNANPALQKGKFTPSNSCLLLFPSLNFS